MQTKTLLLVVVVVLLLSVITVYCIKKKDLHSEAACMLTPLCCNHFSFQIGIVDKVFKEYEMTTFRNTIHCYGNNPLLCYCR